jgi:HlyD family secretion protein
MSGKNILITLAVVIAGAGVVGANLYFKRDKGVSVTTETIRARDLEAVVSASGKIQPKRLVNITAETSGRVVNLAVNEGDRIRTGQFLLQIDPKTLRSRVDNSEASLQVAAVSLDQMRQSVETARVQLEQAKQTLVRQQGLWKQQLTTRAELEKAENDVKTAESSLQERDKSAMAQESRIMQERAGLDSAKYDLTKVRIESPIDGIVTRNGHDRHDEQRRHGVADAGRHVDHPGRSGSGRDEHSECASRPNRQDQHRRDSRQVVQGPRD